MMPDTAEFVDAHIHLWVLSVLGYRWLEDEGDPGEEDLLGDYRMLRCDWGPERLFREFHGQRVIGCVHVEANTSADPVAETEWLGSISQEFGFPSALVCYCDLGVAGAPDVLQAQLAASSLVRGVRMREHPIDWNTRDFRRAYATLGDHALSYEMAGGPGHLQSARLLAESFPDVTLVVGHSGLPDRPTPEAREVWRRGIEALGRCPNVVCKVAGLPGRHWSLETHGSWMTHCLDTFGPDRLMFGSNWPVGLLYEPYIAQLDEYRGLLEQAGYSSSERASAMSQTARRIYRLQPSIAHCSASN
jgi:predicted TIM-barrel fold metal-dependent hydrolase